MTITLGYWPPKDPADKHPVEVDWTGLIPSADSIQTSTWVITPTGNINDLAVANPPPSIESAFVTRVWVEKGIAGVVYQITNHVVTAQGRIREKTGGLVVNEQ